MPKFNEFPLSKVGTSVQLTGGVWSGDGRHYLVMFPEEEQYFDYDIVLADTEDWKKLLRQSDLMEVEVLEKREDGKLYKGIARKCQRHIDQKVSWHVFKRDGYACRYCGRDDVPLTVDHLVLWENGGPSTEANLVSACKKCNKTRGNTSYADWLTHPRYRRTAEALTQEQRQANLEIVATLDGIELNVRVSSKR
jgi:hypothetical protein